MVRMHRRSIKRKKSDTQLINPEQITSSLSVNVSRFKKIFSFPDNSDVTIREIMIGGSNKKAALLYINTITNIDEINERIISPLLTNTDPLKQVQQIIATQQISTETVIKKIADAVNKGSCVLFINELKHALIIDTPKFESRSVEKTENENLVKGPKEAFTENASVNISLVRKRIKNPQLIFEKITVSKRSNDGIFFAYIKDLANEELVNHVRNKLNSIDTDSIQNLSILEQYIEERKLSLFPTILYTERPDRAATLLEDGFVILLMDNSPDALILPATFWAFFHHPEDHYLRISSGNFSRLIRIIATFIALFSSATYVAVTSFHSEMVPPDLLLAIAATREKVPFTALIEVILMELAFELIREAGLRVPTPVGPTIGIVGALILGEAAVQANVVSPIVVIVVALSGLTSFVIGNISMNFTIRISKFAMIIAASILGIYGMTAVFVIGITYMVGIKSFGVPYLAPLSPHYKTSKGTIFRHLLTQELFRPGYLKPKDMKKRSDDVT